MKNKFQPGEFWRRRAKRRLRQFVGAAVLGSLVVMGGPERSESALSRDEVEAMRLQTLRQIEQGIDTKVSLALDPASGDADLLFDTLPLGLALPIYQTLREDVSLRITRGGFTFLAQQVQRLLYGWVRRDQLHTAAESSALMAINGSLVGFKSGLELSVPVVGTAKGCIYLKNSNDDDGRGTGNYPNHTATNASWSGSCRCNESFTADGNHGLDTNFFTDHCTECWIGETGGQSNPPQWGWNDLLQR